MAVKLQEIVVFGRSLDEYIKMFNVMPADLQKNILSVADGPASFNAEATPQGYSVTSVDPIYQFSAEEILSRFNDVVDDIIEQVRNTPDDWSWSYHASPDALRHSRVKTIQTFLQDYNQGRQEERYRIGTLPNLDFQDNEFELVLCSHFLFLYSEHLDYRFHRDAVFEMLRVGTEVRIFPLMTLEIERSPHLEPLCEELVQQGYHISIEKSNYEFQKGSNEVMVIRTPYNSSSVEE